MRILILTGAVSETELFRLVISHAVASVFDLRPGDHSPTTRILRDIYHRPSPTMARQVLERLIRNWSGPDQALMIWVDATGLPHFKSEIGALQPNAQIETIAEQ